MKKIVCMIVLVFAFCTYSSAEVDIEVGGDIQVRGIYRNGFGLISADSESENWFDSYIRAYVKGTSSPGLSALVRIICERDWGAEGITVSNPLTGEEKTENTTEIDLDLGYLVLSEAWGSPAAIILGRQELLYGEGFLVGRNNTYRTATYERSPRKAFDAVRVSFPFEFLTLDMFTALIDEGYDESDVNLHGVNITYEHLDTATLALGIFYKDDSSNDSKTIAFSMRGELDVIAIPGFSLKAEIVPEVGDYSATRDLNAFGGYVGALYSYKEKLRFIGKPYIGVNYILMTGDADPSATTGDYKQFDPLYEDEVYGEINELNSNLGLNTNAKILNIKLGSKLTDTISLQLDYYGLSRDEEVDETDDFGTEVDLKVNFEYREDVTFALTLGYFDPAPAIGTEEAIQVTGAVKMVF